MNSRNILFFLLILVACLSQFASDVYSPAIPIIAANLKSSINLVQMSMAIYMFGVAISLLIYGPLAEGFGRKNPLIVGLTIMLLGSILSWFAPNIYCLLVGRFIQGCGAGACAGLWRAIFRDVFTGKALAKYGSYLSIAIVFIVPAAPAIGAYLQHLLSWRAIFAFLSIYGVIALFLVIYKFKETSKHHHHDKLTIKYMISTYRRLLISPIFMGITISTFLSYGAFFAWFTVGPVLLIHQLKMNVITFGWISFIGGGIAYALAGWLNGKLVSHFGMKTMLRFGWGTMIFSGGLMLWSYYFVGINPWSIFVPALLFYFGSTFIWPNAFAIAFTPYGDIAGYAGALYSFMQILGAAIIGTLISHLPHFNQLPLAYVFIMASLLAWLNYELIVKNRSH